ncbi:MAG: ASCH domain-containing protein [Pseudomonadales bacterium]|nr:ASCH domain-containing protein [Pseudomonadales bacterium]
MKNLLGSLALLLTCWTAPQIATARSTVAECDARAAHPDDPDRIGAGVERQDIDLPAAIAACERAAIAEPTNFRVRYQLARALFYAGQNARAVTVMREAADGGYAQAQFVFGTFIDRGREAAPTDICLTEDYWRKAAAGGRQAARVAYIRHTLHGRFKACPHTATHDELAALLGTAATAATNYYERLLVEDLTTELANARRAAAATPPGARTAEFACTKGTDVAALNGIRTRRLGETTEMTNQLIALIMSGEKTITATSPWIYDGDPDRKPVANGYSMLLDADGKAHAVLRTVEVKTVPFNAVTAADSRYEGPSVRPLAVWRKIHTAYFNKQLAPLGKSWSADMPVTLERFEVVCRSR